MMNIEVVYLPKAEQLIKRHVAYMDGLTVADVLTQSELIADYPEIAQLNVGIFSTIVTLDTRVKPGDRVELYRPLLIDPKEKRRQRAR